MEAPMPDTKSAARAKERRRIDAGINRKHDKARRKLKEVRGKRVDWIEYSLEENWLCVNIRFMDRTAFHLEFEPRMLAKGGELTDWKTGNGKTLKRYRSSEIRMP
jgi:hypothetical protein